MSPSPAPATGSYPAIDRVVARLSAIVDETGRRGDRAGYFAALYRRVTEGVRDALRAGRFDDGPRMERLDVAFAGRYLYAYDQVRRGELPSRSWLQAFAAAGRGDLTVLQHIGLGMSTHIQLDLGIAAARTCPGAALDGLKADFDLINDLLAGLTATVEEELAATLDRMSPALEQIADLAQAATGPLAARFASRLMAGARDAAWRFAVELAGLPPAAQLASMVRRDDEVVRFGDALLAPAPVARLLGAIDGQDVAGNIALLARMEKT